MFVSNLAQYMPSPELFAVPSYEERSLLNKQSIPNFGRKCVLATDCRAREVSTSNPTLRLSNAEFLESGWKHRKA